MKIKLIKLGFQQLTTDYTDAKNILFDFISVIRGVILNFLSPSLVLACLLAFLPAIVFSEDAGQPPVDNETNFESTANRLNLTAEQKEKIKALRQNQSQQMKALFQELQAKRQEIRTKLNDPATTRESIAPLAAELKDIQEKMVDLRINNIFTIKETLHSDQLDKLQQFRQQRTGKAKDRRTFGLEKRRGAKEEINQEK